MVYFRQSLSTCSIMMEGTVDVVVEEYVSCHWLQLLNLVLHSSHAEHLSTNRKGPDSPGFTADHGANTPKHTHDVFHWSGD